MRHGRFESYKELFEAFKLGKRLSHVKFNEDQFLYMDEGVIRNQAGIAVEEIALGFDSHPRDYFLHRIQPTPKEIMAKRD